ncbi:hypothetical protein BC833DRAFT_571035 [Globomyces pollinis-pini]|nr:hypothetical protein BC833DRAFT_571035 [Globomyces pollinis-pini]
MDSTRQESVKQNAANVKELSPETQKGISSVRTMLEPEKGSKSTESPQKPTTSKPEAPGLPPPTKHLSTLKPTGKASAPSASPHCPMQLVKIPQKHHHLENQPPRKKNQLPLIHP